MQAWQEEAERARQGQREAESKLSTLEVVLYLVLTINTLRLLIGNYYFFL